MVKKIGKFFLVIPIVLTLISGVGISLVLFQFTTAASITWDGGGGNSDWCTDANWSNNAEPTSADSITLDVASTITTSGCVSESHNINFSSLTVGGTNTTTLEIQANIGTGGSIIIASKGTISQKNATAQSISGTLTVQSGGTLTHSDNTTSKQYILDFSAANIDIQSGGSVDVDYKGYRGGNGHNFGGYAASGPGRGLNTGLYVGGSGAGYGGYGGDSYWGSSFAQTGGSGYCDINNINELGSGGGGSNYGYGGDGGGLIRLVASGTVTIDGTVTADGYMGKLNDSEIGGGGGAGGGIYISAATIAGTPTSFTAVGGAALQAGGTQSYGGAGGGGCVSVNYSAASSITYSNISFYGGSAGGSSKYGGAGVLKINDGTNNYLYSINQGTVGANTFLTGTTTAYSFSLASGASYVVTSSQSLVFTSSDAITTSGTSTLKITGGTLQTPSTFSINDFSLEYWASSTWVGSSGVDLTIGNGGTFDMRYFTSSSCFHLGDVVVQSGGKIVHGDNSTAQTHIINLCANNLTIDNGGSIDLDGRGYDGGVFGSGYGPGAGSYTGNQGTGGGHGGAGGGTAGGAGGTAYCSIYGPYTIGSGGGGGTGSTGGNGGGLVMLTVANTTTINGTITADGTVGSGSYGTGGGSGGGVYITTGGLTGTPQSITANGANSNVPASGGGGGGGCIFFYYSGVSDLGSPGTVTGGDGYEDGGVGSSVMNQEPRVTVNSLSQKNDGSGDVLFNIDVDDADDNDAIVRIDYKSGSSCSSGLSDPTFDLASMVVSYGLLDFNNDDPQQIQGISTASGPNTLTFDWLGLTDEPLADGLYCVKFTTYDGINSGTSTTTVTLDNIAPTAAGVPTLDTVGVTTATLAYGVASVETNFREYKVFYATSSPVTQSNLSITSSTNADLSSISFGGNTTFFLDSLFENTQYFVSIWTYDMYGLFSNSSELTFTTAHGATPGVTLSKTSISMVEGATDSYTMVLVDQPSADVVVGLSTPDGISLSQNEVIFTTSSWNTPVQIDVQSIDDAISTGTAHLVISHTVSSTDLNYNGISMSSVNLTITDNDTPGITFYEPGGANVVGENGVTDTVTFVLDSQPSADVNISLSLLTSQVSLSSSLLTFTSGDWNQVQTVTISAIDDYLAEGGHYDQIVFDVSSGDANYSALSIATTTVLIADNDIPDIVVNPTTLSIGEGGLSSYSIELSSQPTDNVTVSIYENSSLYSLSTTSIVFTSLNWDQPVSVEIDTIDDTADNGDVTSNIQHLSTSNDPNYDSQLIDSVSVTIEDNDSTPPGSGTITPVYPRGEFSINDGFSFSSSTHIVLSVSSTRAVSYQLGEGISTGDCLYGSIFYTITDSSFVTSYDVSTGDGLKKICVKFFSNTGHSVDEVNSISIDTSPPVLTNVSVDTGVVGGVLVTYPTLSGRVTETNLNGLKFFVSVNGQALSPTESNTRDWKIVLPVSTMGTYDVSVYAMDLAGNASIEEEKQFSISTDTKVDCSLYPPDIFRVDALDKSNVPLDGTGVINFITREDGRIIDGIFKVYFKGGCPAMKIEKVDRWWMYKFYLDGNDKNDDQFVYITGDSVERVYSEMSIYRVGWSFYNLFISSLRKKYSLPYNAVVDFPSPFYIRMGLYSLSDLYTSGNTVKLLTKFESVQDYCSTTPVPSSCYTDTDKDGVSDIFDNCDLVPNPDQKDTDDDLFGDVCDNCPLVNNPSQADNNFNGQGDQCEEPDQDADGIPDSRDNCVAIKNKDQSDIDGDGKGDVCDVCPGDKNDDIDQDGRCAEVDNCPDKKNPDQSDVDSDGVGNDCDLCPNDATNQCVDMCPKDPNKMLPGLCGCGVVEDTGDADSDGRINCLDLCPSDKNKIRPGACGCGQDESCDLCPADPAKTHPGICGCGNPEEDINEDGVVDCGVIELPCEGDECIVPCEGPDCPVPCTGPDCENIIPPEENTIVDNVINFIDELFNLDIKQTVKDLFDILNITVFDPVFSVFQNAGAFIQRIADDPRVEKFNQEVVVPTTLVVGAASAALGVSFTQILAVLRNLFTQPFVLLRRRKQKKWGVVYNAFNKQPVGLATIRVVDALTNNVVRSQVTDGEGRFLFNIQPGRYKLEITSDAYSGFSEYLLSSNEDSQYINLYHGEEINITEKDSILNYNIPLDPISKPKNLEQILKDRSSKYVRSGFGLFGVLVSAISVFISPTPLVFGTLGFQILFFGVTYKLAYVKIGGGWGTVSDIEGKSLPGVIVRIFDAGYNKLVNSTTVDNHGRYALLTGPSKYYVTFEKEGYEIGKSEIIDLSSEKTHGMGGMINVNFKLKKKI